MEYRIQNGNLELAVAAHGAEPVSLREKESGRELLWQADPAVWERHAPLLFPHCGKLAGSVLRAKGKEHPAAQHGFARDQAFRCTLRQAEALEFTLADSPATRARFPYAFVLRVRYTLLPFGMRQQVSVENPAGAGEELPFSIGFHPGFALPLESGLPADAHEFAFEQPENPQVVETPGGYVSGKTHPLFANGPQTALPLADDLFADDSICLSGLRSGSITLRPRQGEGRRIRVGTEGFPYVLLWGPPRGPLPFVCIEPWHSLPDGPEEHGEFAAKPGLTLLAPRQRFSTVLSVEIER